MLFLQDAGLVFLAMPKAASQSIRKALLPHAADLGAEEPSRHINIEMFNRDLRARFEDRIGRRVETFAVVRNPVERLSSWHRYRQRPAIAGTPNSTRGIGFEAFVKATLEPDPVPFAALGTQDRFVSWDGTTAAVDYLFDYPRLDLMVGFLAARLGAVVALDTVNKSRPKVAPPVELLSKPALRALRAGYAAEFALHHAVRKAGILMRR